MIRTAILGVSSLLVAAPVAHAVCDGERVCGCVVSCLCDPVCRCVLVCVGIC